MYQEANQAVSDQQFNFFFAFSSMNGVLEFYDTSDVVCMNQAEHFMATDVEWDPTGRYVATSVSWWAHKVGCLFSLIKVIYC